MADDSYACPSCGARVPAGADHCDLCGTPVHSTEHETEEKTDSSAASQGSTADQDAETEEAQHVFCNDCGLKNPPEANYCSRCGQGLQDLSSSAPADHTRTVGADLPSALSKSESEDDNSSAGTQDQTAMGKQILAMVGIGVLLVLGFFFVTQWSQQYEWGESGGNGSGTTTAGAAQSPSGSSAGAGASNETAPADAGSSTGEPEASLRSLVDELGGPVEGPVADKIDSLRVAVDAASGGEKRQVRAELVQMYIGAGTPGRAALVQRQLADETGTVEDQRRAADLLYRWMRQVEQQQDRASMADVARHVASAYQAVVNQRPEDLDARTRMGEAYLLTNNPMNGIQAINAVLEEDSMFVPARFQKGLALLQINRLDQAVQEFQKVKKHADPQQPFYKQAERAIEVINEQRSSGANAAGKVQQ